MRAPLGFKKVLLLSQNDFPRLENQNLVFSGRTTTPSKAGRELYRSGKVPARVYAGNFATKSSGFAALIYAAAPGPTQRGQNPRKRFAFSNTASSAATPSPTASNVCWARAIARLAHMTFDGNRALRQSSVRTCRTASRNLLLVYSVQTMEVR